jgi:hypothetical protein
MNAMPSAEILTNLFRKVQPPAGGVTSEKILRARIAEEYGDSSKRDAHKRQCEHLIGFTEFRFPRYRPATHQRFIAEQLERVERGEIDRLMLLMPPRHGKSELASKSMPAWSIDHDRHYLGPLANALADHPRARPPSRAFGLAQPIAELAPRVFLLRARRQAGPTAGWRVPRRWGRPNDWRRWRRRMNDGRRRRRRMNDRRWRRGRTHDRRRWRRCMNDRRLRRRMNDRRRRGWMTG